MKAVNIRVEEELYDYLQKRAEKEHRTLSNMIISILLDEKEKSNDKPWFLYMRDTSIVSIRIKSVYIIFFRQDSCRD